MLRAKSQRPKSGDIMNTCTLQWTIWIAAMVIFTALALSGRWTDLGIALVITGVLWYTLVPEYHSGRQ